jgi:transcription elongation factor Elf1
MYLEIKYLNLLSPRLDKFKQKKDYLWNFRCPVCGDSKRNKNKVRGFVFQVKGDLLYKCHNCGYSVPLAKLIELLDPVLYKQYRLEKFQDSNKPRLDTRKVKRVISTTPVFRKNILCDLTPLENLNNSHPAKEYILNRQLPTQALYFTEKFKEWTNSVKPNTFQDTKQDEPRIIIPFIDKEGVVFGFQGRSLHHTGLRYITILLEEDRPKIFGMNTVDYGKTIYICEGPLDSLLLSNAVAMAGSDVSNCHNHLGDDVVYVYDNEPRNLQITSRIDKHIKAGDRVVIWPHTIKEKDINDMILSGHPVQKIVRDCTYSGLTASLKLNDWRK